jgi:HK97 family phage major capsid protein
MTVTPEALREKRSQLVAACEQYAETATPDAVKAFDAAEEEIRAIDGQLSSLSVRSRLDAVKAAGNQVLRPESRAGARTTVQDLARQIQRRDTTPLDLDMRTLLTVATAATAGNTTVTQQTGEFVKWLDWDNPVRMLATVQSFPTNLDLPVIDAKMTASYVSESTQAAANNYPESNFTTIKKSFTAHKTAAYTDITEELLNDSVVDLAAEIVIDHARAHGKARADKHVVGNGSGQEEGIAIPGNWDTANVVKTGAVGTEADFDDIITLYSKIKPGYQQNGSWIMNANTWATLLKIRDAGATGKYLYDGMQGMLLQDGSTGRLMGRPVYISEYMPDAGAQASTAIFFGDLSRGYRIVDRTQVTFRVDPYTVGLAGKVRYLSMMRSDGKIVDKYAGGVIRREA